MAESLHEFAPPLTLPATADTPPGGARRVAVGYLLVALVPLVAAITPAWRYAVILALHLGVAVLLLIVPRAANRAALTVGAWLPLLAIPLMYAELPYLISAVGAPFGDAAVQGWEQGLWGGQPARELAARLPSWLLSELLHLAYLSYYAVIYAPFAYLWLRSRQAPGEAADAARRAFGEASLAVIVTFVLCFAGFVLFPVQGPRYLWPAPTGMPAGPVRDLVLAVLERGSSRGAAFPSSHMAVAVVQAMMAYRWRLPGRLPILLATIGIGVGAVYGGFHYAIDMIAGAGLGVVVFVVASLRRAARS